MLGNPSTPSKKLPLNCPFCDELSFQKLRSKRIATSNKIYTKRECIMGHVFYSVEEVPKDQDRIEREIKEIRRLRVEQR